MKRSETDKATYRVQKWKENPEASVTSVVASRILDGTWTGSAEVEEQGANPSILTPIKKTLILAGYHIEERTPEGMPANAREYRVNGNAPRRRTVGRERTGTTHPEVGSMVLVRAVAIDETGELALTIAGNAGAWNVRIIAHMEGE